LVCYDPSNDFAGLTNEEVIYLRAQYSIAVEQSVIQIVRGKRGISTSDPQYGTFLIREVSVVEIDVKPGGEATCGGVIPVAILGSETLDVTQIDRTTLSFEGLEVRQRGNGQLACNIADQNGDGYLDLVCQYQDATTVGGLTGELLDGTPIEGSDTICVAR